MTTTYTPSGRLSITPAYLTGGNSATSVAATWAAVGDGSFSITIDGVQYDITGINFAGSLSMLTVAAKIQTALRAETGSTETVVRSSNHFVISSVNATSSSAITVTSAVSPSVGTDISGAGGTAFMDADDGHGVVTDAVYNATAYTGRSGVLRLYSYLTDVSGNYITDRRGYRFVVNGSDFYRGTTYIPTR